MEIINIEQGHPTVQQAMVKLQNGIYHARATGKPLAKIVHGYGSSGTGGAIKQAIGIELRKYISRRMIVSYCPGEDFGPFSAAGRAISEKHPEASRVMKRVFRKNIFFIEIELRTLCF